MAQGQTARRGQPALITQARRPRTLDSAARQRRYLITMGIRLACVVSLVWLPGWWKLVAVAGAAILPVVAVLLANAMDQRTPASEPEPTETGRLAITGGIVVPGDVDDGPGLERDARSGEAPGSRG